MKLIGSSLRRTFASLSALAMGAALLVAGAAHAAPTSSIIVPIHGAPGLAMLSGNATIETTLVQDELGGAPSVLVSIKVSNLIGAPGVRASGEAVLVRPLASSDTVEVELAVTGSDAPAFATFALRLDPATGAALSATATVQ